MAGFAAAYARMGGDTSHELFSRRGWTKLLLVTFIVQLAFYLFDLYDLHATRSYRRVLTNLAVALGAATVMLSILFYALPVLELGRGVFLVEMAFVAAIIPAWRLMVAWGEGHPQLGVRERVLILGSGEQAVEIARATLERRNAGFHVVGFVDNIPELVGKSLINPSVVGLTDDIVMLVERHQVDRIVVAVEDRRGKFPTEELLNLTLSGRVAVEESARYYERLTGKIASEMLRPSWLIFSRNSRYSAVARHVRRVLNAGLAAAGFVLSLPVMILTAIAVKLDSPGPIFYTQERVGMNGRLFKIIKFRSMCTGAESQSGPVWAEASDPRVTRVGRIIRKLRLDELPQFINVIRGDMNFVGPRPERPVFVERLSEIIPYYSQRHLIKPGLTGWAQIKYPYGASVEDAMEKLRYDLYYIKNQSLLLDAVIVFETVKTVLFGRGSR
ncbi:MAG TPA: TIGR03013 family XrtA/PEP-CTERM system glycosyltransferase [Blastocatellia bacterium]|jgi:sugar transferase (PEP-CTERM system associated)|nr:TIGR03013 family XrtA/PEP-CTERM system glycosyltransferase [Blastocatellia bacterium]